MFRASVLIVTILACLGLVAGLLWREADVPHAERQIDADPRKPSSQAEQTSRPPHPGGALGPTETSPSREKRADIQSDSADASAAPSPVVPSLAIVRSTLADAIASQLPDLLLSEGELDQLAEATLRMRLARERLRLLPKTRAEASRRNLALQSLEEAVAAFTAIAEMTPGEFTRRVQPGVGIDEFPTDAVPADVSIRRLTRGGESE